MILKTKMKKTTTNFEPTDDSHAINKAYLDEKLKKIDGHISHIENDCNQFKLQYNKPSVEEVLVQRAVKTTIQTLYDKGSVDKFQNADKILEYFLFITSRRDDLSEQVMDVIH